MGRPYQARGKADSHNFLWLLKAVASMLKRLEQVTALVVAAGLAIVSYWLFFSWAQGDSQKPMRISEPIAKPNQKENPKPLPRAN
jgi:hypothetical protein